MKRALIALLLPIFASFLILGCDGTGTAPDASTGTEQNRASEIEDLTGKELYRGFLFGQGKVASMFPELFDLPETLDEQTLETADNRIESTSKEDIREAYQEAREVNPEEYRRFTRALSAKVASQVQKGNPDFFRQFERRMKSGNPAEVEKALASMSEVTTPAMAKVLDVSEKTLRSQGEDLSYPKGLIDVYVLTDTVVALSRGLAIVALGGVAVAVSLAFVINYAAATNKVKVSGFSGTGKSTSLEQEMTVSRITDRLAI